MDTDARRQTPLLRGFILAAGFGRRLRPLTDHFPKPLAPLSTGCRLVDFAMAFCREAGCAELGVNAFHLADALHAHLRRAPAPPDAFFREPEILGTGGALSNARPWLAEADAVLLHNGDILHDFDPRLLIEAHTRSGAAATMLLADSRENTVAIDADGAVVDVAGRLGAPLPPGGRLLTYTGVAVLSRAFFAVVPVRPAFQPLVDFLVELIRQSPASVRAHLQPAAYWNDIGTVPRYLDALRDIHEGRAAVRPGHPARRDASAFPPGAAIGPDARLDGFAILLPGASVGAGARVSNCVLLEGASVPPAARRSWEVLGDGFSAHRDVERLAALPILSDYDVPAAMARPLLEQGSSRSFHRLQTPEGPRVLLVSNEDADDFRFFLAIGRHLRRLGLGAPEIFRVDERGRSLLMEDLGDTTLHAAVAVAAGPPEAEALYGKVLDYLADFQLRGMEEAGLCPELAERRMDYDTLRWETDYFSENFLGRLAGLAGRLPPGLQDEYHSLAVQTLQQPSVLIHRDFQSQNILLADGAVRIVDFQGARPGPLMYDVASLLNDPYVELPDSMRLRLLARHADRLAALGVARMPEGDVLRSFAMAALQRNCQALGAYGFLSLVRGKRAYLAYVRPGLSRLRWALWLAAESNGGRPPFPLLDATVRARIDDARLDARLRLLSAA